MFIVGRNLGRKRRHVDDGETKGDDGETKEADVDVEHSRNDGDDAIAPPKNDGVDTVQTEEKRTADDVNNDEDAIIGEPQGAVTDDVFRFPSDDDISAGHHEGSWYHQDYEADVDYVDITADPDMLTWMMPAATISFGTRCRPLSYEESEPEQPMVLVAYAPAYIYIEQKYKATLVLLLGNHFSTVFKANSDPTILLADTNHRLNCSDFVQLMSWASVPSMRYITYGEKASISSMTWLGRIPEEYHAKVILDIGFEEHSVEETNGKLHWSLGLVDFLTPWQHGARMTDHHYEVYPMFVSAQQGSIWGGSATVTRHGRSNHRMIKAKLYSTMIHTVKSITNYEFYPHWSSMKTMRYERDNLVRLRARLGKVNETDPDVFGGGRAEIRLQMNTFASVVKDAYECLEELKPFYRTIPWDNEKMFNSMDKALAWADKFKVFKGRNQNHPTMFQKRALCAVLCDFGITSNAVRRVLYGSNSIIRALNYFDTIKIIWAPTESRAHEQENQGDPPAEPRIEVREEDSDTLSEAEQIEAVELHETDPDTPVEVFLDPTPGDDAESEVYRDVVNNLLVYSRPRTRRVFSRNKAGRVAISAKDEDELYTKVYNKWHDQWREVLLIKE